MIKRAAAIVAGIAAGCLLAGCSRTAPVHNQAVEPQYTLFTRDADGKTFSHMAALLGSSHRQGRPFVVTARIPYLAQPNGMPQKGQLDVATRTEDRLESALKAYGGVHAGHITGGGAVRVVFYTSTQPPAKIEIKTGLLKKEQIEVESRRDEKWEFYEHHLVPTPGEAEINRTRKLLRVLAEQGDDHTKVRPVDIAANFATEAQRTDFIAELTTHDYRPSGAPPWQDDEGRFWCEMVKDLNLEYQVIGNEVLDLRDAAERHGGVFDGWACPVVK